MKAILICALTSLAATLVTFSQPVTRTITDTNGRPMQAKLVSKTATTVAVIRKSDSAKFVIPLEKLSATDQEFIKAWNPDASRKEARAYSDQADAEPYKPLTRGGYPSPYQPRYSSGGGGGGGYSSGGSRYTLHRSNGPTSGGPGTGPSPNCRLVGRVVTTTRTPCPR